MSDDPGTERTSAEREAARLERERRRRKRNGEPAPAPPAAPAGDEPAVPQADPTPAPASPPPPMPADPEYEEGWATEEHELEVASGTRRVSRAEQMAARRTPARQPANGAGSADGATDGAAARPRPAPPARKPRRAVGKPRRRAGAPAARSRGLSWLIRIVPVVALVLAAAIIWFVVEAFQPFGSSPHGRVTVIVPAKSTSSQIGDLLAREGVVSSSLFFEVRATLEGDRGALRAGVYHLQKGMSYSSVLALMTKAPPAAKVTNLTIVEGRRRAQISKLLHDQGVKGNYLSATRRSHQINFRAYGLRHAPPSLEGFLFPDTYQLTDPIKISALISDQLQAFRQQFATVNLSYARRKRLTPYDVLKIASLIEAEVPTAHDRPLVASVIYNRLHDHMFLGFDSTTSYATGNFSNNLTVSQLHSKSPYNTFTHLGLPPTPINNPGLASIQAAARPANTKYLYFFTTSCKRNAVFATSYRQFNQQNQYYAGKHC
jgi:UPF0755 protein